MLVEKNRNWLRLAFPFVLAGIALFLGWQTKVVEAELRSPFPVVAPPVFHEGLVTRLGAGSLSLDAQKIPIPSTLQPGETLHGVLVGLGLTSLEAQRLGSRFDEFVDLRRLRPGDVYSALYRPDGGLEGFDLVSTARDSSSRGKLRATRCPACGEEEAEGDWQITWQEYVKQIEIRSVSGQLDGALESAVRRAGGHPMVTYLMADALQWDLDFTRDLRQGDTFRALFEEVYLEGHYEGLGRLLAVQYENQGRRIEAYRFGDDGGLYDAEGRPLRKMFLRSPLRYSRVSSRFSHRRLHPVLGTYRPHYGVDYAAPVGTPVRATASGKISFVGWDRGGGGNVVKVRHPNDFETAYLHLSRFAQGAKLGAHVQQGEVVGFVGATGLATGAHLDYRVKRRGRYLDPMSIKSVPARPVSQSLLPEFLEWRDALRESLMSGEPPAVTPRLRQRSKSERVAERGLEAEETLGR